MLNRRALLVRILLHIGALIPLTLLAWDLALGQLTADPIREVQLRTGRYALILLTLTLACTPVYNLTGFKETLMVRRPLGLYAFGYTCLHLLNFIGVDYRFDLALLWPDISQKPYIIVGFVAFLILLALAVTSTAGWMKRLGRNWGRLHAAVYAAALIADLHYWWQLKVNENGPLIYGAIIVVLLLLRLPPVKRLARR